MGKPTIQVTNEAAINKWLMSLYRDQTKWQRLQKYLTTQLAAQVQTLLLSQSQQTHVTKQCSAYVKQSAIHQKNRTIIKPAVRKLSRSLRDLYCGRIVRHKAASKSLAALKRGMKTAAAKKQIIIALQQMLALKMQKAALAKWKRLSPAQRRRTKVIKVTLKIPTNVQIFNFVSSTLQSTFFTMYGSQVVGSSFNASLQALIKQYTPRSSLSMR